MACSPSDAFAEWLCRHQSHVSGKRLTEILLIYGRPIHPSSGYRACLKFGLVGHRRNRGRYFQLWAAINWSLPNSTLARIWGLDYGNLRARRIRLGAGEPRWHVHRDGADPVFQAALSLERLKARRYRGARPAVREPFERNSNGDHN
jgi:hypothetical protein